MNITNNNATTADSDTATRDYAASHRSRNAINQYRRGTRCNSAWMRSVLRFGVRCERVTHAGDWFAVNQYIGGAGNNPGGWESLVVCTQVTQQHNFLAHSFVPSFLEVSSINFRGRHWHHTTYGKQRLTKTQPICWCSQAPPYSLVGSG